MLDKSNAHEKDKKLDPCRLSCTLTHKWLCLCLLQQHILLVGWDSFTENGGFESEDIFEPPFMLPPPSEASRWQVITEEANVHFLLTSKVIG